MRVVTSVAAAAVLAAAMIAVPEADAQRRGQGNPVVIINYERVLTETAAGRDLATKLQTLSQQIGAEAQALGPEQQSIEQETQRLQQATRNMSAEQIRAHATHGPAVQALNQRVQAFQLRRQQLEGDFDCSRAFALRDFDQMVRPVIRTVMEGQRATIVVDSRNVWQAADGLDITNTVIQTLDQNQATRVATVNRHGIAECQGQAAPQPAPPPPAQ